MSYYIEVEEISLEDLRVRIEATDLVPSRVSLLEGLGEKLEVLKEHGLADLAALLEVMKAAGDI